MKYSALVNGTTAISANDYKTLLRKASMVANKYNNTVDELIVEGLDGRNRPVLLSRGNGKSENGKTWHGNGN